MRTCCSARRRAEEPHSARAAKHPPRPPSSAFRRRGGRCAGEQGGAGGAEDSKHYVNLYKQRVPDILTWQSNSVRARRRARARAVVLYGATYRTKKTAAPRGSEADLTQTRALRAPSLAAMTEAVVEKPAAEAAIGLTSKHAVKGTRVKTRIGLTSAHRIIGAFAHDGHVVHVAFAQAGAGNADEAGA